MAASQKGSREITVNGEKWRWKVTEKLTIIVWAPDGTEYFPNHHEVVEGADLERGQWKKTDEGMVRPSDIAQYIEKLQAK